MWNCIVWYICIILTLLYKSRFNICLLHAPICCWCICWMEFYRRSQRRWTWPSRSQRAWPESCGDCCGLIIGKLTDKETKQNICLICKYPWYQCAEHKSDKTCQTKSMFNAWRFTGFYTMVSMRYVSYNMRQNFGFSNSATMLCK